MHPDDTAGEPFDDFPLYTGDDDGPSVAEEVLNSPVSLGASSEWLWPFTGPGLFG
jgi:hypothetical protein